MESVSRSIDSPDSAARAAPLHGRKLAVALAIVLIVGAAAFLRSCANQHYRPHGHGDISFDVSPRGDMLVFNAAGEGGRDLYLMDLPTRRVTRIAATPEYEVTPAFSPDGKSILYAAGEPGDRADHIFLRPLDGTKEGRLTSADANDAFPRFSPDGSLIVFERDKTYTWGGLAANWGGGEVICLMNADGTNMRQITPDGAFVCRPWFSADGRLVRFWSNGGLYAIDVNGARAPIRISRLPDLDSVFSPTEDVVAFSRGRFAPDTEIFVTGIDGSDLRQLTTTDEGCFRPLFTPDGKEILFFRETWPNGLTGVPKRSLWRIDTDGANLQQVADYQLFDEPLRWTPDDFER